MGAASASPLGSGSLQAMIAAHLQTMTSCRSNLEYRSIAVSMRESHRKSGRVVSSMSAFSAIEQAIIIGDGPSLLVVAACP